MEKVEQVSKWMSSDDQSGSSQTRCYSCTFCKRGFSNAQALGGHMNIHRRDRARIRQQLSEENQLSNSEAAMLKTKTLVDPDNKAPFQLEQLSQLQQISHITKRPFSLVIKDNEQHIMSTTSTAENTSSYQEQFEQLPLFDEEAPISEAEKVGDHFDENMTEELDLELRLGRESRRDTSLTLSTREFF